MAERIVRVISAFDAEHAAMPVAVLARRAGLTNIHGIAAEYTGPTLIHFMVREAISIAVNFLQGNL